MPKPESFIAIHLERQMTRNSDKHLENRTPHIHPNMRRSYVRVPSKLFANSNAVRTTVVVVRNKHHKLPRKEFLQELPVFDIFSLTTYLKIQPLKVLAVKLLIHSSEETFAALSGQYAARHRRGP